MSDIDKEWFVSRLAAVGKSQAALARHLGLPPSSVTRLLDGKRKLKLSEAEAVARFLSVTTEEVLAKAGVKLAADSGSAPEVGSIIDGSGNVKPIPETMAVSTETMNLLRANIPLNKRSSFEVAQVRSSKGELWTLDDNLVLFETPTEINPGPASALSVVKLRDGSMLLGKVMDWRKTGEATVRLASGETRKVMLAAASPVMLIVP